MWQPIETAPKDGTLIVIVGIERAGSSLIPSLVFWNHDHWETLHYCYEESIALNPTHWMLLPELPTE